MLGRFDDALGQGPILDVGAGTTIRLALSL
jgi:hypothetical protein